MRLVSAHISQWNVKFAGKWDSVLKGNSALRAHVARAAGTELAHNEGQHVIHFLCPSVLGTSATDLGIETGAGNGICAANQWKRIWKGRAKGQESSPSVQDEL